MIWYKDAFSKKQVKEIHYYNNYFFDYAQKFWKFLKTNNNDFARKLMEVTRACKKKHTLIYLITM